MAIQSFQLDPDHKHEYRRPKQLGYQQGSNWNWEQLPDDVRLKNGDVGFKVVVATTTKPK